MESLLKIKERGSPVALAPGMGVNAIVAYTVCIGMGVDWRVAMSVVFVEGLVILVLVLCGLRRAIMDAIPADLRLAIGIGVGVFVESVVGAAAGARTGLSSIVVGIMFVLLAFLAPFIGMVSGSATCGALTVVGYLMMKSIGDIDWSRIGLGFPAFLIVVGIPFTYLIANGIGLGFISYVVIMVLIGRVRDVKPLMWVAAFAFLVMFVVG